MSTPPIRAIACSLVILLAGCRGPSPTLLPETATVAVTPFTIADDVRVERVDDITGLPAAITNAVVEQLRARRRTATVVTDREGAAPELVVTGRVVAVDGGSTGGQWGATALALICWPCAIPVYRSASGSVVVEGEVHRPNGELVGAFVIERRGGGMSTESRTAQAAGTIGRNIGDMVYRGQYRSNAPHRAVKVAEPPPASRTLPASAAVTAADQGTPTVAPQAPAREMTPSAVARGAADRLRELEQLHEEGLITDDEYRAKRRQVVDGL